MTDLPEHSRQHQRSAGGTHEGSGGGAMRRGRSESDIPEHSPTGAGSGARSWPTNSARRSAQLRTRLSGDGGRRAGNYCDGKPAR